MILRDHFGGVFFFKQKTAYEMRISDWSSDVCSSDLPAPHVRHSARHHNTGQRCERANGRRWIAPDYGETRVGMAVPDLRKAAPRETFHSLHIGAVIHLRSEEHTSELQSLMRISYAVFCLKKKKTQQHLLKLETHHISHQN